MRRRPATLLPLALVTCAVLAAAVAAAQPRAAVSYAAFEAEGSPYLEVYITAEHASLAPAPGGRRALDVLLTVTAERTAAGATGPQSVVTATDSLVLADRVTLWSPPGDTVHNFVEALRYSVPAGEYRLRLELTDPNVSSDDDRVESSATGPLSLKLATPVTLRVPTDALRLSDIQLVASSTPVTEATSTSSLVKGGAVLEPLAGNLVRRGMTGASAYVEVYRPASAMDAPAVLEHNLARVRDDGEVEDLVRKTKRLTEPQATTPVFVSYDTSPLPSGQYLLTVTLRDRALQQLDQRIASFFVANPAADQELADAVAPADSAWVEEIPADSLRYVLLSLIPVADQDEGTIIQGAIQSRNEEVRRRTILNHFTAAAPRPNLAARQYREYMAVVREVDAAFRSGFGRGFQTDRGHVWLKYGQPDDRVAVDNDPSAPPYEIWVYNYVERTRQTPGKFLFYNPSLDNANFVMLHSTVRGEIREPRWRRELYSKTIGEFGDPDGAQGIDVGDNVGRYADQYFNDN